MDIIDKINNFLSQKHLSGSDIMNTLQFLEILLKLFPEIYVEPILNNL